MPGISLKQFLSSNLSFCNLNATFGKNNVNCCLICCHLNLLFVFNTDQMHVFICSTSIPVHQVIDDDIAFESHILLTLSSPPCFPICNISLNNRGDLMALWGSNGVMIAQLPMELYFNNTFADFNSNYLCKSWLIDSKRLYFNDLILKVKWHPGCKEGIHLVVLCSDNVMCIYDVHQPNLPRQSSLVTSFVGINSNEHDEMFTTCNSKILSPKKQNFGFTDADFNLNFTFGSPIFDGTDNNLEKSLILWPIYILNGVGDVVCMLTELTDYNQYPIQSPYAMLPSEDSNYELNACDILCITSVPFPVVIIANKSGKLYNCILLPSFEDDVECLFWERQCELHVYECIDLEFDKSEIVNGINLQLFADDSFPGRYFCICQNGLYCITLNWIHELVDLVKSNDDINCFSDIPATVDNILPGKMFINSESYKVKFYGLCVLSKFQRRPLLISITAALLNSGFAEEVNSTDVKMWLSVLGLRYVSNDIFLPTQDANQTVLSDNESTNWPTLNYDKFADFLQRNLNKEHMCQKFDANSSKQLISSKDAIDVLNRYTFFLKNDYVYNLDTLRTACETKVIQLSEVKGHQYNQKIEIEKKFETLKKQIKNLVELSTRLKTNNLDLWNRLEVVADKARNISVIVSEKEKSMLSELNDKSCLMIQMQENLKMIENKVKSYKSKHSQQKEKNLVNANLNREKKAMQLATEQNVQISDLVQLVDQLKINNAI